MFNGVAVIAEPILKFSRSNGKIFFANGMTLMPRARSLMVLVGSRKAVSMAVRNAVREPRYSLLLEKLITGGPMS